MGRSKKPTRSTIEIAPRKHIGSGGAGTGELVYGRRAVAEAKRGRRRVRRVWTTPEVSASELARLAGSPDHQGVVAEVDPYPYADPDSLLDRPDALVVALDQVQDPRNLGALLRTADAFGVHGVIVPKHHAVGLTEAAARTAMGAVEHIPVARETNLVSALEKLKESGVWIYGAAAERGIAPWAADLTGPLCLVLGSEGEGLRPLVVRACDVMVTVPMQGGVGSLNVAAAGAALCYEVARQREARSTPSDPKTA